MSITGILIGWELPRSLETANHSTKRAVSHSNKIYAAKCLQAWVTDLHWISRNGRELSHAFCLICNYYFSVAA